VLRGVTERFSNLNPTHRVAAGPSVGAPRLMCTVWPVMRRAADPGYLYLIRQVAAADATERGRPSLADYYSSEGETPSWCQVIAGNVH
jgi:hypothetical protein